MRVIALSATLPNLADIGDWIGCEPHSVHYFDETFRPVPLTIHTLALGNMNNPFLFERSLDDKVGDIVTRFSEGKQTLIFCSSKKGAETLAALLARKQGVRFSMEQRREIEDWTQAVQDGQLRELIRAGYAYHHGGLPPDDRATVEQLYLSGHIMVLCSTSTLAHGVNLPAHLVIIKGTNCWRGGSRGYEKMCRSEIIQMLGRAGRPGFDNSGVAVVMTSNQDRDYYAAMSLSAEVVESTLQGILIEGEETLHTS
jgi:ATP-dependent DNA helicase HFM1/MER3